jgi:hypothetical protein
MTYGTSVFLSTSLVKIIYAALRIFYVVKDREKDKPLKMHHSHPTFHANQRIPFVCGC